MKRLIFTVTNDLNYDQRMIRICSTLADAGYNVELVGRLKKDSPKKSSQPFKQTRLKCFFEKGKFFYLEYNIRLLVYLLFKFRGNGIVAIDLDTILPCWLVASWKQIPCIYDAHEYYTESPEIIRRPIIKKIWEWVGQLTIPRCDHWYTVAPELAKELSKKYGVPFEVIRNLPFKRDHKQAITSGEPVVLYQGYLNEGRGIEEMIEALQFLPGVQLWLLGEGDLSVELRELVKEWRLQSRVTFLGKMEPADFNATTSKATIGINFLKKDSLNYYFSLANKALDYIQAGLPSIQMDFPEYRAINEAYEVYRLIPNLEIPNIVAGVNELLSDKFYYQKLQENCRIAAKELNWERESEKLIQYYNQIFNSL